MSPALQPCGEAIGSGTGTFSVAPHRQAKAATSAGNVTFVTASVRSLMPRRVSGRVEDDHAAAFAACGEVGERLGCLVDRIGARDQFVELEPAAAVQADEARKILLRPRRSIITAGQGLLAERYLLRIQGNLILADPRYRR